MSILCGLPVLECVYCLACARWAWKRCLHTAGHDSATWGLATAEEFEPVPRICRQILAVYEDDLRNPLWEPPGGYGINPDWLILKRTYEDTQGRAPPYILYLDHNHADIVLVFRGLNLAKESDYAVLLDNKLGERKFDGGYVHNGLLKAAGWVLEKECDALKCVVEKYPNYCLTFAGHSLGSGVAALLTMVVVRNLDKLGNIDRRRVRCYAIAPARCMSLNLAVRYADVINSIVLQDDFLPRTATPLEDIFKSLFCLPCLLCLRCMRDTCISEEKMLKDPRRLYAPGRLYHIVERKPFRMGRFPPVVRTAVPVDGRFEHIVLSCNAISDHAIIWIEREAQRALDMQIAEVKASSNPDAMKSEGNDSLDTIIRQAIGKEPFLSFSRAGDSPVQLIQLLHALDRQEPLGWTLLSPPKVQMQKCDKCSREFCSPINYRRHIRVHHRLKKLDKDSMKNRDLLGAFWDKLTMEDVKEVVSFKNVTLEEVPGSSIIIALTTLVHQPGFLSLPHMYIKAGSAVLDIIEARPSRFAISSQELFSILDDASEKTFLSGSVLSMQRYIFDGDAGKIGLESKNLVACTSFLLEQKLIKAWLADKDTEAMRFQKMLVEEEEAAHRRHAELLERKRQKKIRQKELKAREQEYDDRVDVIGSIDEMLEAELPAQASASYETCNLQTSMPEMSHHITCSNMNHPNTDTNADSELHLGVGYHCDLGPNLDVERHTVQGTRRKHLVGYHWQEQPKSQRATSNFFLAGRNSHPFEIGGMQSCRMQRDLRTTYTGNKIWSRKHKPEFDGEILKARVEKEDPNEPDQKKNHKVVIGSITVSLGDCTQEGNNLYGSCHACLTEHQRLENNFEDKPNTPDSVQVFANRSTVRLWRPVSRNGVKGPMPVQNNTRESNCEGAKEDHSESLDGESCPRPRGISMNDCDDAIANCSINPDGTGSFGLSSHAAKAFLAQRWKAAIATEHVRLVLSPESEDSLEVQNGSKKAKSHSSKLHKRNILGIAEYGVVNVEPLEISTAGAAKPKSRLIPEKRIKYIPKPRTPT